MIEPIVKEIVVSASPAEAFRVFTSQIDVWWPVATHSLSASDGKLPISVAIQPGVGGSIEEILHDGSKASWGIITEWVPSEKLAFSWHLRRPESQQSHVRVEFQNVAAGTRLRLVHNGWDAIGDPGAQEREQYFSGWDVVLNNFVAMLPG